MKIPLHNVDFDAKRKIINMNKHGYKRMNDLSSIDVHIPWQILMLTYTDKLCQQIVSECIPFNVIQVASKSTGA